MKGEGDRRLGEIGEDIFCPGEEDQYQDCAGGEDGA
jgi:hypothetical protein